MTARVLASMMALAAWGQERPAFHSSVELVTIPCAVVDAHGAAVGGLTREEFRVTDNGVRRIIENLWLDTDVPVTLGVILDASESQKEQLVEHRQTASDLLERILGPGDGSFVTEVHGSSPLWDAIYEAARLKMRPVKGSKALLILTDGFDSGSTHTWRQAVAAAQEADTSVYAIQYRSGLGGTYAPDLYRLVTEAGGTWFAPPTGEYGPIVSRLQTDLRRRYVLGFQPERVSGKVRHDVEIEVTRPELSVRARKTYFRVVE